MTPALALSPPKRPRLLPRHRSLGKVRDAAMLH
jgi:hypothetical protein